MSTVQQTKDQMPPEKLSQVNFSVPDDFKLALDLAVKGERTTLREFCVRTLAEKLGIPVPGEEPARKRA